jgi:hypothetical protein
MKELFLGLFSKRAGLTNQELANIGVATEVENIRIRRLMEQSLLEIREMEMVLPTTEVGKTISTLSKGINKMSRGFSMMTLAYHMNDWAKRVVGRLLLSDIPRILQQPYSKLSKSDHNRLAELRINAEAHAGMQEQFARFGEDYKGTVIAHVDRWDNPKLKQHFNAEVLSFVNKTIITPVVLANEWQNLLFMFKRFAFARTQHFYQNLNMPIREKVLTWLPTSIAMTGISKGLKLCLAGRAIDWASPGIYYEIVEDGGFVSNFASIFMHFAGSASHRQKRTSFC